MKNNKDPLDEIFVVKQKVKEKYGQWEFRKIDSKFILWFNSWADFDEHSECLNKNKRTDFGEGYKQCIRDIFEKLKLNYREFDRRTKTGFKK